MIIIIDIVNISKKNIWYKGINVKNKLTNSLYFLPNKRPKISIFYFNSEVEIEKK